MIELAYQTAEKTGLALWNQDEAGPYQTLPYPGKSWEPESHPALPPHEYARNGVAKILTLFHPASGQVRVKDVTSSANIVLHPWLKEQLTEILAALPEKPVLTPEANRAVWLAWQKGLSMPITLPEDLPPLRMLMIWDNLRGHYTTEMLLWLFQHGILPVFTPIGGSWLNMAESMQRILVQRALSGQHPETPEQIMSLLEGVAQGWNLEPTPFEWGGKRAARRQRSRARRHALGGSGAYVRRPILRNKNLFQKWQESRQPTHYFRTLRKNGLWKQLNTAIRKAVRVQAGKEPQASAMIIDSQSAKNAEGREEIGFDGGKQVRGRKRTLITDTLRLVILAKVAAANTADVHAGKAALLELKSQPEWFERLKKIFADGGYPGDLVTWVKHELNAGLEIVFRSDDQKGFQVLPVRWVIERTNAWVTRNQRLARDYSITAQHLP